MVDRIVITTVKVKTIFVFSVSESVEIVQASTQTSRHTYSIDTTTLPDFTGEPSIPTLAYLE